MARTPKKKPANVRKPTKRGRKKETPPAIDPDTGEVMTEVIDGEKWETVKASEPLKMKEIKEYTGIYEGFRKTRFGFALRFADGLEVYSVQNSEFLVVRSREFEGKRIKIVNHGMIKSPATGNPMYDVEVKVSRGRA